jgi:lysozyme
MKTNRAGIDLIKKWEGCELVAYPDPATNGEPWTIGYGHTSAAGMPMVRKGLRLDQQEAEDILVRDLVQYEAAVSKALARNPTENQFSAMVSLCFNIGQGNFASSSVVKYFNAGQPFAAADAFLLWRKANGRVMNGLVNRRMAERVLFLSPVSSVEVPKPVPVPAPKRTVLGWLRSLFK